MAFVLGTRNTILRERKFVVIMVNILTDNDWKCSSVVEHFPDMFKVLGSIPNFAKTTIIIN